MDVLASLEQPKPSHEMPTSLVATWPMERRPQSTPRPAQRASLAVQQPTALVAAAPAAMPRPTGGPAARRRRKQRSGRLVSSLVATTASAAVAAAPRPQPTVAPHGSHRRRHHRRFSGLLNLLDASAPKPTDAPRSHGGGGGGHHSGHHRSGVKHLFSTNLVATAASTAAVPAPTSGPRVPRQQRHRRRSARGVKLFDARGMLPASDGEEENPADAEATATNWSTAAFTAAFVSGDGRTIAATRRTGAPFVSRDSGSSFTELGLPPAVRAWRHLALSRSGESMAAASDYFGVHTSHDAGRTWARAAIDGGATLAWAALSISQDGRRIDALALATAAALSTRTPTRLVSSVDGGITWSMAHASGLPSTAATMASSQADGMWQCAGSAHDCLSPRTWPWAVASADGSRGVAVDTEHNLWVGACGASDSGETPSWALPVAIEPSSSTHI